jgi:hypothetical protein
MSAATMYMTLLSQRSGVSISVVSDPTVNVAPVIGVAADVTPAVWSSGVTDTERWEMADTDAGPWTTVDDMLTIDAAYTDQTFGKVVRWYEAQGGVEAVSEATGRVAALMDDQTSGAELVANGTFSSDTAWTKGTGWTIGSGVAHCDGTQNPSTTLIQQNAAVVDGAYHEATFALSNRVAGSVTPLIGGGTAGIARTSNNTYTDIMRATGPAAVYLRGNSTFVGDVDDYSVKTITPRALLDAPSADMRISQFYTLAASPVEGHRVRLFARVSDFSAGDFWEVVLLRNAGQWDIDLYTVATHTRTPRATAPNVGVTNGIRLIMNGDQVSLWTTANGGTNWTQRDTTKTQSLYQSETGIVLLHSSGITPGLLVFENP